MEKQRREVEHRLLDGTTGAALDDNDRLLEHIACRSCGYDLVSMHKGQQCPECGAPVAFSIGEDLLCYSEPGWAARVGQHVRVGGGLLMLLPVILIIETIVSRPVDGIAPGFILMAWSYTVLQATRREPTQLVLSRSEQWLRYSAGATGLLLVLAFAAMALRLPLSGPVLFTLASVAFLGSVTLYLRWLSALILRIPANDLCDSLQRHLWTIAALSIVVVVLVLTQAAIGAIFVGFFFAAPAWAFYLLRVGHGCVQAGEMILYESRRARQNWLEREALLDKDRPFRDPTHRPTTQDPGSFPDRL